MRELVDGARIHAFMREIGRAARHHPCRIYFTGGATAVLMGWRQSTIDLDIHLIPESDEVLRAVPKLKEELAVNVELACPADFIPELPGWETRSIFIQQEGKIAFYHYDLYAQALSKIERGHVQDRADVREMISRGLVDPAELQRLFECVEPYLYRYPAVHPASFRQAVEAVTETASPP